MRTKQVINNNILLLLTILSILSPICWAIPDLTCPAGWYKNTSQNRCIPCAAGFECPSGATSQTSCSSGEYTLGFASSCIACPAGFHCPNTSTINRCRSGYYCAGGSANEVECPANYKCTPTSQVQCPIGTYSSAGSASCEPCRAGRYCSSLGGGEAACQNGHYSGIGKSSCTICPIGYKCPTKDKPPIKCEQGTYQSMQGQTTCNTCSAGKKCSNSQSQDNCPSGFYSDSGAAYCILCPAGSKCSGGVKTACNANQYAFAGSSSCSSCQNGYHCTSTEHYKCPPGTVQNSNSCVAVSSGKYSADQITQLTCTAGQYINSDKTGCIACPQGHACDGSSAPSACSSNQYVDSSSTCQNCPNNQPCHTTIGAPTSCANGYYVATPGSFCSLCPRGFKCTGGTKTACGPNQTSFQGASTCMSTTKAGFTSSSFPVSAPYGFYKNSSGQIAQCPEDSYCPSPLHSPIACPSGWWSPAGLWTCVVKAPAVHSPVSPFIFGVSTLTAPIHYQTGDDFAYPCPLGMYANAGDGKCKLIEKQKQWSSKTTAPSNCPSGYYSLQGQSYCRPIPAGFQYKNNVVSPCDAGKFSIGAQDTCTSCPSGTFSKKAATKCQECIAGYKCQSNSLVICPAGQYSFSKMSTCAACTPGFICHQGSTTPTPVQFSCPRGFYCELSGDKVIQTACPAGKYGVMERGSSEAQACHTCPAGYNCPSGAEDYIWYPCSPHKYCPRGTTSQQACPNYTYFPGLGAKAQHQCMQVLEGYYLSGDIMTICPIGNYCPGKNTKQICPDGTYNNDQGSISIDQCLPCPPGHTCTTTGQITGNASVLRYIPYSGAARANQYRSPSGSGYNTQESALYYAIQQEQNKVAEIGMALELCQNGLYSGYNGLSQDDCVRCALGGNCNDGLTVAVCPQGKYCPHNFQNYTADCPRGTYGGSTGLKHVDECTQCPAGKFCPGGGTSTQNCPVGFYCPAQTPTPIRCPDGYYGASTDLTALSKCTICDYDNYCRDGFKIQCPIGTYQPSKGQNQCLQCPGGYFCDQSGSKVRKLCPKGKYSAPGDPEGCLNCQKGYACRRRGISLIDLPLFRCENGYNCDTEGTTDAVLLDKFGQYSLSGIIYNCPEGFYHLKYGSTSIADCIRIPAGYYSTIADFISSNGSLLPCTVGHYCPEGTSAPIQCPKSSYNPVRFAKSVQDCFECPAGFKCPSTGMSSFIACDNGHYCPEGTDIPEPCPQGTYDDVGKLKSSAQCKLCPQNKYCPDRGYTSTGVNCYAGFYCRRGSPRPDPIGKIYGDICPAGSYCQSGQGLRSCPAGTYNPNKGGKTQADCAPCTPGFFCKGSNSPNPTDKCKGGFFCNIVLATGKGSDTQTQNSAQPGFYAPEGSPIQIPCPPGTYSTNVQQAACTNCQKGKYCPDSQMTAPLQCPQGFYCPSKVQQDTDSLIYNKIPCPPGTFGAAQSLQTRDSCSPCTAGYACPFYSMTAGNTYQCKAGFYCKTQATSVNPAIEDPAGNFGPCPKGHYCAAGTSTPTACAAGKFLPYYGARAESQCIPCHPGMYCSRTGLSQPQGSCRQGRYCAKGNSNPDGIECTKTHYCPRGTGVEIKCPDGTYSDTTGAYECRPCPSGSYCVGGSIVECVEGTYCPGA